MADRSDADRDAEAQVWNTVLESGTPEQIEQAKEGALGLVHTRIMNDDPNYREAGWSR